MRHKQPKAETGYRGGYGGMGSRPAPKVWMPGSGKPSRVRSRAAEKFRKLQLRARSKRGDREAGDTSPPAVDVRLGLFLMAVGLASLFATVKEVLPWSLGPLLFLLFAGAGAVFLGRGVSKFQVRRRAANPEAERARIAAPSTVSILMARLQGWALLLGGFGVWFLIGFRLWGPFEPIKAVVAIALILGLGVSFNVGNPYRQDGARARGYFRGRHAARAQTWSLWRRCVAVATGSLLIAVGIWQEQGHGVGSSMASPLSSVLCLIIACAVGVPLIVIATTRRRRPQRHT